MRAQKHYYQEQRAAWNRYYAACRSGAPEAERTALLRAWQQAWGRLRAQRIAGAR